MASASDKDRRIEFHLSESVVVACLEAVIFVLLSAGLLLMSSEQWRFPVGLSAVLSGYVDPPCMAQTLKARVSCRSFKERCGVLYLQILLFRRLKIPLGSRVLVPAAASSFHGQRSVETDGQ